MMPIEIGSGFASSSEEVVVPGHASVSGVSAACAVDKPTSTTAGAMHAQRRSIPKQPQPVEPARAYTPPFAQSHPKFRAPIEGRQATPEPSPRSHRRGVGGPPDPVTEKKKKNPPEIERLFLFSFALPTHPLVTRVLPDASQFDLTH